MEGKGPDEQLPVLRSLNFLGKIAGVGALVIPVSLGYGSCLSFYLEGIGVE